jgi:TPR repeat protein
MPATAPTLSIETLTTQAQQGDVNAQYQLGNLYADHVNLATYDFTAAMNWLTQAATAGHVRAQVALGHLYTAGDHTRPRECQDGGGHEGSDSCETIKWFRCAAESGDAEAQYEMGMACLCGDGVDEDPREAVKWFLKAAEQGEVSAQLALAEVYSHGDLGKPDYEEAIRWARKAVEGGNEAAEPLLGRLLREGILDEFTRAYKAGGSAAQWVNNTFGPAAMDCLHSPMQDVYVSFEDED